MTLVSIFVVAKKCKPEAKEKKKHKAGNKHYKQVNASFLVVSTSVSSSPDGCILSCDYQSEISIINAHHSVYLDPIWKLLCCSFLRLCFMELLITAITIICSTAL